MKYEAIEIVSHLWPILISLIMLIFGLAATYVKVKQNCRGVREIKESLYKDGFPIYMSRNEVHEEMRGLNLNNKNSVSRVYQRYEELDRRIGEKMSIEKHQDVCAIATFGMKQFINEVLEEKVSRIFEKIDESNRINDKLVNLVEGQQKQIDELKKKGE